MIVVDASAVAAFILKEQGWERLIRYIKDSASVDHVVKEVANTIWKYFRRGLIGEDDARTRLKALMKLTEKNIVLHNELTVIEEAFNIALRQRITVYDSLYIALAKNLNLPLLTLDNTLAQAAKAEGVKVINIKNTT